VLCYHQHQFQVLTKRPERVLELSSKLNWTDNIWMGTSVESQDYVHRVHTLSEVKAKVRFLSIEPLLGPLSRLPLSNIDWVIVGGESGPNSRPMEKKWVRTIRDRCIRYDVPFFFKQWGGVQKSKTGRILDGETWDELPIEYGRALRGNKKRSLAKAS
jgi:protein gp37